MFTTHTDQQLTKQTNRQLLKQKQQQQKASSHKSTCE